MSVLDTIRRLPFPQNLAAFNLTCDYHPEPLQFMAQVELIRHRETANCWARQLGKTYFESMTALFLATVYGYRGGYFVPQEDQAQAPLEYWSGTPWFDGKSENWIKVNGKKMIKTGPLTTNLMRSSHLDFMIFDEQAFLKKKQEILCKVAEKQIQNSPFRRIARVSTPLIGTEFETDFLRLQGKNAAYRYTYQDFEYAGNYPAWLQPAVVEIQEKAQMVADGHYPKWLFDQETLALFAAQGGSIFTDYELRDLAVDPTLPEWIGIDINPKAGHTATVCVRPYPNTLYFKEVIDLSADTRWAAQLIKARMRHNTSVELELNGAGEEAIKTFYEVLDNDYLGSFQGIEWNEQLRLNRALELMKYHVVVSHQARKFYDQFRAAQWDSNKKNTPLKNADDHWIDAGYHSAHWGSGVLSAGAW